jgi:hypothetical protein
VVAHFLYDLNFPGGLIRSIQIGKFKDCLLDLFLFLVYDCHLVVPKIEKLYSGDVFDVVVGKFVDSVEAEVKLLQVGTVSQSRQLPDLT